MKVRLRIDNDQHRDEVMTVINAMTMILNDLECVVVVDTYGDKVADNWESWQDPSCDWRRYP